MHGHQARAVETTSRGITRSGEGNDNQIHAHDEAVPKQDLGSRHGVCLEPWNRLDLVSYHRGDTVREFELERAF